MRWIDKMSDRVRDGIRSFLRIEPARQNMIYINEKYDYETNAAKNRIWYRGEAAELEQFYKAAGGDKTLFWAAVPTAGLELQKRHTGLPGIMIDTLTSVVMRDLNSIEVDERESDWEAINKDIRLKSVIEDALSETLVVGDGAFKLSIDKEISRYPIVEFVAGDRIEYVYKRGHLREIVFRSSYTQKSKTYVLKEHYGYGYVDSKLYYDDREVPLATVPELAELSPHIEYDNTFMLAVPFRIFKSNKWSNRGKSVFDSKADSFDSLDETWSQWMDALRKGRSKEYIPDSLIPRNETTGEFLKPNAFDNAFIRVNTSMNENSKDQIELKQPAIPHESYLSTYITALDLCLQGVISPSTLGIDTKKLDNAEAQREKEKTTLYTRNKVIEALEETIPELVNVIFKTYDTDNNQSVKDCTVTLTFGEYANPSFESQVETVSKAKQGGIMSIEASIEELYGDSKDDEWKAEEVIRLKSELGLSSEIELGMNMENADIQENVLEEQKM